MPECTKEGIHGSIWIGSLAAACNAMRLQATRSSLRLGRQLRGSGEFEAFLGFPSFSSILDYHELLSLLQLLHFSFLPTSRPGGRS